MRYQVFYNQGMFQVIDTQANTVHSDFETIAGAAITCATLNNESAGLLVLVDGQVRPINSLEIEMLAIIRTMASKLHDAAEQWEGYVKNFPEPANDYRINADFKDCLKQFGL
jgi:hypothetical protein